MKGKGKKEKDVEEECSLQLSELESIDHVRFCPRYAAVLNRTEEEGVGLEDLDVLQIELESLLVSVTRRHMLVEDEMEALPKDKKTVLKVDLSGKRKASKETIEERPVKKLKETSSSLCSSSSSVTSGSSKSHAKAKSKNVASKDYDYELTAQHHYRNDIPDRFCRFIDPYCAPIKTENVKTLEDMIKTYEEDCDLYKVPALGKHYSLKWASVDSVWDGKKETTPKNSEKKRGLSAINSVSADKSRLSKKHKDLKSDTEKGGFGALTQRLVSCLLEEQANGQDLDIESDQINKNGDGNFLKELKGISLGNCVQLEKRIKKELEENGFLDFDDVIGPTEAAVADEDEVLRELIKCQNDLKATSTQSESQLKLLLSHSKADLARSELKKKLQVADIEVQELYRRMVAAKQKKKNPSKKEKDQVIKALRERDQIVKQLDSLHAV